MAYSTSMLTQQSSASACELYRQLSFGRAKAALRLIDSRNRQAEQELICVMPPPHLTPLVHYIGCY